MQKVLKNALSVPKKNSFKINYYKPVPGTYTKEFSSNVEKFNLYFFYWYLKTF